MYMSRRSVSSHSSDTTFQIQPTTRVVLVYSPHSLYLWSLCGSRCVCLSAYAYSQLLDPKLVQADPQTGQNVLYTIKTGNMNRQRPIMPVSWRTYSGICEILDMILIKCPSNLKHWCFGCNKILIERAAPHHGASGRRPLDGYMIWWKSKRIICMTRYLFNFGKQQKSCMEKAKILDCRSKQSICLFFSARSDGMDTIIVPCRMMFLLREFFC